MSPSKEGRLLLVMVLTGRLLLLVQLLELLLVHTLAIIVLSGLDANVVEHHLSVSNGLWSTRNGYRPEVAQRRQGIISEHWSGCDRKRTKKYHGNHPPGRVALMPPYRATTRHFIHTLSEFIGINGVVP